MMDVGIWGCIAVLYNMHCYLQTWRVLTLSQENNLNLDSQEFYSAPWPLFKALRLFKVTQQELVSPLLASKNAST